MGFIDFVWPASPGEWGAWAAAVATLAGGLFAFLMPRAALRLTGTPVRSTDAAGLTALRRGAGGFSIGFAGWTLVFHPQPLLYIALGTALALSALGRLMAALANRPRPPILFLVALLNAILAAPPLLYAFGIIR